MSLSSGGGDCLEHNSGAGAQLPPGLRREGRGTVEGANHAPKKGSKYSVPRQPGLSLRMFSLRLCIKLFWGLGKEGAGGSICLLGMPRLREGNSSVCKPLWSVDDQSLPPAIPS